MDATQRNASAALTSLQNARRWFTKAPKRETDAKGRLTGGIHQSLSMNDAKMFIQREQVNNFSSHISLESVKQQSEMTSVGKLFNELENDCRDFLGMKNSFN